MIALTNEEARRLVMILEWFDAIVASQEQCPHCYAHIRNERHDDNCTTKLARQHRDALNRAINLAEQEQG